MKGVVEEFFEKIGMKEKETYDPNSGRSYLHPGRQADIIYKGSKIGFLAKYIRKWRILMASENGRTSL